MTVTKFRSILGKVASKVQLDRDARLTWEVSRPGEPMQVYDVARIEIKSDQTIMRLGSRPAICKPRHRAQQAGVLACCG